MDFETYPPLPPDSDSEFNYDNQPNVEENVDEDVGKKVGKKEVDIS
jgi:hypothetical protein